MSTPLAAVALIHLLRSTDDWRPVCGLDQVVSGSTLRALVTCQACLGRGTTALCLFEHLCNVGNALATYRDTYEPCSDGWAQLTCVIVSLDAAIDLLVRSSGLVCDNREDACDAV